jgi:hypothetical protein
MSGAPEKTAAPELCSGCGAELGDECRSCPNCDPPCPHCDEPEAAATAPFLVLLLDSHPRCGWEVREVSSRLDADKLRGRWKVQRIIAIDCIGSSDCGPRARFPELAEHDDLWRYLRHEVLEPMALGAGVQLEVKC